MNIKVKSEVQESSKNKIKVSLANGYQKGVIMTKIYLNQTSYPINEYPNGRLRNTHYIVETNRLSMMLCPQLNFILRQFSLYFFQKNIRCWIEQNYHHTTVSLHFLVTEPEQSSIFWTDTFSFKSYVENMLGEPCTLWTGGGCYV